MLSLFSNSQPATPIKEIIRAVRVLQKKRISAILVVEKSNQIKNSISAEEIIGRVLQSHQGAVRLNFEEIKSINCLLPFPEKVCRKEYSDQELGCLGLSQSSRAVIVSISASGEITVCYNNSLRRSISPQRLHSILVLLFNQREPVAKKT